MVLITPSWHAFQSLLSVFEDAADKISMFFNTEKKTVCMVFNPSNKCQLICSQFPEFMLVGCKLEFVEHFRYLVHIV